jgi:hypothetical protein
VVRIIIYDAAVVVSDVRIHGARVFRAEVDFVRSVRSWHFATCQLPAVVELPDGALRRPAGW